MEIFYIITLSFILNVLWSMLGRARNRNNLIYHGVLVFLSNLLWILFMKKLMTSDTESLIYGSLGGTVGAICGQPLSMFIEKFIKAKSDDHIN